MCACVFVCVFKYIFMVSHLTASESSRLKELLRDGNDSDDSLDANPQFDPSDPVDDIGDVDLATLLAEVEDSTGQVARHQAAMDEQARELLLLKASLEEDMRESVQHRERLMAMKDLYTMRDDIATLHEQRLELRANIAAAAGQFRASVLAAGTQQLSRVIRGVCAVRT